MCDSNCGTNKITCSVECMPECNRLLMEGISPLAQQPANQGELDTIVKQGTNICRIRAESSPALKWPKFLSFSLWKDTFNPTDYYSLPIPLPDEGSSHSAPSVEPSAAPSSTDDVDWDWAIYGSAIICLIALPVVLSSTVALLKKILPIGRPQETKRVSDKDAHPEPQPAIVHNNSGYDEHINIYELRDGDVLPGRNFDANDPDSFYRELLTINFKEDSRAYLVLEIAESMGESMRKQGRTTLEIANKVADMVQLMFADGQGHSIVLEGKNQTVGEFFQEGGCCRHRSALLQMAYQKAGVRSRYIQGLMFGAHAWVEVDVNDNNKYDFAVDLNVNSRGMIEYLPTNPYFNEVCYKVGKIAYFRKVDRFNKVWRPNVALDPKSTTQISAELLTEMYRSEMRDAAQKLGLETALSGAEAKALRGETSPEVATRDAAVDAARDMDKDHDRDGVSSSREAMETLKAEARDRSGRKK